MGRYYRISKKLTKDQAEKVKEELGKLEGVEYVEFSEDLTGLKVVAKDSKFSEVMGNAVNICSRAAAGAELSFARFCYSTF